MKVNERRTVVGVDWPRPNVSPPTVERDGRACGLQLSGNLTMRPHSTPCLLLSVITHVAGKNRRDGRDFDVSHKVEESAADAEDLTPRSLVKAGGLAQFTRKWRRVSINESTNDTVV